MIRFDCVTLFPQMFAAVTDWGITRRALEREILTEGPDFAALAAQQRGMFRGPVHADDEIVHLFLKAGSS